MVLEAEDLAEGGAQGDGKQLGEGDVKCFLKRKSRKIMEKNH